MKKKTKGLLLGGLLCAAVIGGAAAAIVLSTQYKTEGSAYTIPQLDLSQKPANTPENLAYLYDTAVVDKQADYFAHPDAVLLQNGDILTVYPQGHGKGAIRAKLSSDGGVSYTKTLENTPASWENSEETPTIYRLRFTQANTADKLLLISANPDWPLQKSKTGGFHCSLSLDEGQSWSEFSLFYPRYAENGVVPIVAMSSLTQLKENGVFVDKWMGTFHDKDFYNYKTILSFDEDGNMQWSAPERYFAAHRKIEKASNMCEVEVIRSEGGQGDELCLLTRSNTKRCNSLVSFSSDEGKTWSEPRELPAALNGERHKAEYAPDGRLVITFRSIERDNPKAYTNKHWYSEGWVAWVGTYADIQQGNEGQYRIKLAHTYLPGQTEPQKSANADTGYCGNVVLNDGTVVLSTYGCFDAADWVNGKSELRTFIISKRLRLRDLDALAAIQAAQP